VPVRLSANLGFLWADLPHLERIERAAAAGFRAVEMHWPYEVPAEDIAAALRRHGLAAVGINTPRGDVARGDNGLAAQPGREAEFDEAFALSLHYARTIGFGAIHVMAGRTPPAQFAAARATYRANLARASALAAEQGVTVLIEPLNSSDAPGNHLSSVDDAASVVAMVGAPNLKIMFDVYHVARESGDVERRLRRVFPMVGHVQIAAVPDRDEPDSGEIDYRHIFGLLEELGWAGWVGAEYRPRAGMETGLVWRDRLGVA